MTSSEAGRELDFRDRQPENARFSISLSFEPGSNVNDERWAKSAKHLSRSTSTEAGT
jgi:hypothetical protein